MILFLRILEAMFSKYTSFTYELDDLVVDVILLVVGKVFIDFLIWI